MTEYSAEDAVVTFLSAPTPSNYALLLGFAKETGQEWASLWASVSARAKHVVPKVLAPDPMLEPRTQAVRLRTGEVWNGVDTVKAWGHFGVGVTADKGRCVLSFSTGGVLYNCLLLEGNHGDKGRIRFGLREAEWWAQWLAERWAVLPEPDAGDEVISKLGQEITEQFTALLAQSPPPWNVTHAAEVGAKLDAKLAGLGAKLDAFSKAAVAGTVRVPGLAKRPPLRDLEEVRRRVEPFACADMTRPTIQGWWVQDGIAYATEGHTAIACPVEGIPDGDYGAAVAAGEKFPGNTHPNLPALFDGAHKTREGRALWTVDVLADPLLDALAVVKPFRGVTSKSVNGQRLRFTLSANQLQVSSTLYCGTIRGPVAGPWTLAWIDCRDHHPELKVSVSSDLLARCLATTKRGEPVRLGFWWDSVSQIHIETVQDRCILMPAV